MTRTSRADKLNPTRPRVPIVVERRKMASRRQQLWEAFIWLIDIHEKNVGLWCRRCYQVLHRSKASHTLSALGYRHLTEHVRSEAMMKRKQITGGQ